MINDSIDYEGFSKKSLPIVIFLLLHLSAFAQTKGHGNGDQK